MVKRKLLLQICLGTIMLFTSCSKSLDRDDAFVIIKNHFNYPQAYKFNVPLGTKQVKGPDRQALQPLVDAGLLRVQNTRSLLMHSANLTLTHKGEQYVVSKGDDWAGKYAQVVSHTVDLKEITGIKLNESGTEAEVEYVLHLVKMTPYGPYGFQDNLTNAQNGWPVKAKLSLFDDGWRVQSQRSDSPCEKLNGMPIGKAEDFQKYFEPGFAELDDEIHGDADSFSSEAVKTP